MLVVMSVLDSHMIDLFEEGEYIVVILFMLLMLYINCGMV
jgi:hypothetical protein